MGRGRASGPPSLPNSIRKTSAGGTFSAVPNQDGQLEEARQSFDRLLALPHDAMMDNNISYDLANAGSTWRSPGS